MGGKICTARRLRSELLNWSAEKMKQRRGTELEGDGGQGRSTSWEKGTTEESGAGRYLLKCP